jgi:hypothetical protein
MKTLTPLLISALLPLSACTQVGQQITAAHSAVTIQTATTTSDSPEIRKAIRVPKQPLKTSTKDTSKNSEWTWETTYESRQIVASYIVP